MLLLRRPRSTSELMEAIMGNNKYTFRQFRSINARVRYHLQVLKKRGLVDFKTEKTVGMGTGYTSKIWYVNRERLKALIQGNDKQSPKQ